MDLKSYLAEKRRLINAEISRYLDEEAEHPLSEIMRYALEGGKRFRPILVISSAEACGIDGNRVLPAAIALEMVHNFSLIHDDLPCMDNDGYRRGRETCHKKFGETEALLAGDALLIHAFEVMARSAETGNFHPAVVLTAIKLLAKSAGHHGMTGGQTLDMRWQGSRYVDAEILTTIHNKKTGALITASVMMGGILAEAPPEKLDLLRTYGENIGLTYQIIDDIIDLETDNEKKVLSFPATFGIEKAREMAKEATKKAIDALDLFGAPAEPLRLIANYLLNRKY